MSSSLSAGGTRDLPAGARGSEGSGGSGAFRRPGWEHLGYRRRRHSAPRSATPDRGLNRSADKRRREARIDRHAIARTALRRPPRPRTNAPPAGARDKRRARLWSPWLALGPPRGRSSLELAWALRRPQLEVQHTHTQTSKPQAPTPRPKHTAPRKTCWKQHNIHGNKFDYGPELEARVSNHKYIFTQRPSRDLDTTLKYSCRRQYGTTKVCNITALLTYQNASNTAPHQFYSL